MRIPPPSHAPIDDVTCARSRFRVRCNPGFSPVLTVIVRGECVPVVVLPRQPIGDSH